ncbi:hypothetical protein CW751_01345 [Brumimicrobium salinarum]|uniref:Uncharacterized protein n=1 Tax=Brumimicrobium salinarum TaxID=2058658 RepID=A0A2I0R6L5_9FLAO|nr:hypothetical protein [Brumimicrobium salinarum]PKR82010.1 hypothetical protein CW751_01345 [Brumimicrobium salinarum]
MSKTGFIILFILNLFYSFSQDKITPLPSDLKESSALIKHKKLFLTINDSGGEPMIYVFDKKAQIKHTCYIADAKNTDWEALAYDNEKYLYIADIGNNENKRKDLCVYKLRMDEVLTEDTVKAEQILFSYPEQRHFPPYQSDLYYDAEAMVVKQNVLGENELLIFTKNRTVPFDGIAKIYSLPLVPGEYQANLVADLQLPATNWREESITDATFYNQDELYLLTYSKVYMYKYENEKWVQKKEYLHDSWTQKEGIAADKRFIYLTDENAASIFSHNYLYKQKK